MPTGKDCKKMVLDLLKADAAKGGEGLTVEEIRIAGDMCSGHVLKHLGALMEGQVITRKALATDPVRGRYAMRPPGQRLKLNMG